PSLRFLLCALRSKTAQQRAAGVRIGGGSMPVKDRYRNGRDAKGNVSGMEGHSKNAASEGALRRIEQIIG
ncbi:TPA: hypothetical protein ACPWIV_003032, partial [Pseudomonas aeruginosa]